MAYRAAINGLGRIGRLVLRATRELDRSECEVVAVNDVGAGETIAHLLRHDTVHGPFPGTVTLSDGAIDVGGGPVTLLNEPDPAKLPWRELGVDIVFECTGLFRKRDKAAQHLEAGARRVLVSAPMDDPDETIVYGVNHRYLEPDHAVVSNASCTTNCIVPVVHVLHEGIGIERGYMVTVHAYTGTQNLVDGLHKDLRRARAAAGSMIPTSTGAAKSVGKVLPELGGKIDGAALRVPLTDVSVVYFSFDAPREVSEHEIHHVMREAARGPLSGILGVSEEPLVSADFIHSPFSAVYDMDSTMVVDGRLCTVVAWYDNEWAFAIRMLDTGAVMAGLDGKR